MHTSPEVDQTLHVYWAPGCSSCVKVKEHLASLGVPYRSVNVSTEIGAREALARRGIRSIPVLVRGKAHVFAQSLDEVTQFVGHRYDAPPKMLPSFLFERWIFLLDLAGRYMQACPAALYSADVLKERRRPIGELAFHVFQVADAFLVTMQTGASEWFVRASGPADLDTALDKPRLLAYGTCVTEGLKQYADKATTPFRDEPRALEGGLRSTYEFLDRSSWHSAQHVRQLANVLARDGVPLDPPWDEQYLTGLAVPVNLWE